MDENYLFPQLKVEIGVEMPNDIERKEKLPIALYFIGKMDENYLIYLYLLYKNRQFCDQ